MNRRRCWCWFIESVFHPWLMFFVLRVLPESGQNHFRQIENWRTVRELVILCAMDKSRLQIKVGLFVLIGLVLLAFLVIQFSKSSSLFRGTYKLRLHAVNVGGLKEQAGVLLAGVQVGTVAHIQLNEGGTNVTMILKIYKDYPIHGDARFAIEQSGFLGDQFVAVNPTDNLQLPLTNGADVYCEAPFNLQEVARATSGFIQRIDETAKKLDASVSDLQRVVLNEATLTNFAVAIGNARAFSEQALGTVNDINSIIATNAAQVGVAVSNAVVFSQDLTHLAVDADNLLATNGAEISVAVNNVKSSTDTLKKLTDDLQAGNGLAGTLLQNEQLATNVQSIAENLSVTTSNLNRLGLWGIMWAHKPPATNAPAHGAHNSTH
jgi:phospholipid/cholesterol/gamma-HCH transport system substrate-binding protein